ncbi:amino acid permease [Acidianus sulfidivorans JP7]|uniref:Amino acid permease n=1 Tax=Acidianus sulfidivorans JP7 TaxID=619593 RepID=A0A2U9ILM0_9CREN|nr:APC family permease [Acidianus sulfidivorans]AWR96900.1 amino acid permease [Acidianus sulfidivorans JP7]
MSKEKEEHYSQEPKRVIGLRDLVFLSLGGQAPFLSILTYGVAAFLYGGFFAPIAIILGTLLVLLNGLVVYKLSTRYTKSGGYYTYAYYSLTKRLGFETGWIYLVYSTLYGSAYVLGATFVLSNVLPINSWIIATVILAISSIFIVSGIKPSAKYAVFASILEIGIMLVIAILFLKSTHFTFYNPFNYHVSVGLLALAILFGSSIPTGYGSITPLSGEVKNPKKTVPFAITAVILIGGLVASFDVYAIGDHMLFYHLVPSSVNLLTLIQNRLGFITLIFVLFAAINDGILATLSYMLATSRTIYAMSSSGFLPKTLSKFEENRGPINASLIAILLYVISVIAALSITGVKPYVAFENVGEIAVMATLFVHAASDFSLFKISLKRMRKRKIEIILSLGAVAFIGWDLIQTIATTTPVIVYIFMGFIILGFLVTEIIAMSEEDEEK